MSKAILKARAPGATSLSLLLDTDPELASPDSIPGVMGADHIWTFELTELTPATEYHYDFDGYDFPGRFRTAPVEGSQASYSVAVAGDSGSAPQYPGTTPNTSNSIAYERILARDPDLFLNLGDWHYRDIGVDDVGLFRRAFRDVAANQRVKDLLAQVPIAYVWDDHDYGPNNSGASSASREAAQQAYRDYVPHHDLPGVDGEIYQTFVRGRVRYILLDVRSNRSPDGATDNSSKTVLGAAQKQWFKDELLAATEPVIVVGMICPWIGSGQITWGSFSTERDELTTFFAANDLSDKLLIINADYHLAGADDGSNSPGGIPVVACAPLDASHSPVDGTYSEGTYRVTRQQYVMLDVDDQGDQVVITATGWAATASSESQLFSKPYTFAAEA